MKTSLLSLFAGTVFLAGAAGASAGEPVTLASADLDAITAGQPEDIATAIAIGAAATNIASVEQANYAYVEGDYNTVWQSNYSSIKQYAKATNSGDVTATASAGPGT